jgi:major membrane immunogen (membrane-anchored lipoprotein)
MRDDAVPDQIVVRLKRGVRDDPRARQLVMSCLPGEARLRGNFDDYGLGLIELPSSISVDDAVRKLTDCEVVEFAEPNFVEIISSAPRSHDSARASVASDMHAALHAAYSADATRKS